MQLGKHVLDKSLLDARGKRAGKVDDLLLMLPDDGGRPVVEAILTGPLALAEESPAWLRRPAALVYRLLGLAHPRPRRVRWQDVTTIDVAVHLGCERDAAGLNPLGEAVARRFIDRIPGA
jgi:hypothetical protein